MRYLVLVALLSGCTITVQDKRLTREEVAAAFAERDAILKALATAIQPLLPKKEGVKK